MDEGDSASLRRTRGGAGRDLVASFSFRPTNHAFTFQVSVTQGELFDYCLQSIPEMCFNPTLPSNSRVFRVVKEGRIDEFRAMLRKGETSIRVHDEEGQGLLYVRYPLQTHFLKITDPATVCSRTAGDL